MSFELLELVGNAQKKKAIVDVRSGDTVRVSQKIKEGAKFRIQIFEGTVIRVDRKSSHTARITVRKIASGVGVEKSFLIHNPLVEKIEIMRRGKVRRNNLSYLRERSGKSARLTNKDFDRHAVNDLSVAEETEVEQAAEEVLEAEVKTPETVAESKNPKGAAEPAE
jgi:large subunit ribosomal protein L19